MHSIQLNQELPSDHELTKALVEGFGTLFQSSQKLEEGLPRQKPVVPNVIYLGGPKDVS